MGMSFALPMSEFLYGTWRIVSVCVCTNKKEDTYERVGCGNVEKVFVAVGRG